MTHPATLTEISSPTSVRDRQDPLIRRYHTAPDEARIVDRAKTTSGVDHDPFHGQVTLGRDSLGAVLPFGIHHAVGGYHDGPNPGDLLCGALAACFDSTLRIVAERMRIEVLSLEVEVTADVDVRGTLLVDREVPVGFQAIHFEVALETAPGTPEPMVEKLLTMAEHCCVNFRTINSTVSMDRKRV
jgi:uncharacterized OsmC-like protein